MLRIIRPKNLLLIALLQCFILYGAGDYNYLFYDILKTGALILSTLLIAAGGYIINDYFDVKIDLVNKPDKVIVGNVLSRRWAIILHISFTIIGLFCAWYINLRTFGIALICAILLYVYSSTFKKQFLIGNIVIAILGALSVIICKTFISDLNEVKIIAYSLFAAFTTLLREIIKDVEDEKGDAAFDSNSLAISLGLRRTKRILLITSFILLGAILVYPFIVLRLIPMEDIFWGAYTLYLFFGIAFPLVLFINKLRKADKHNDFAQLSRLMKIIMLIGIFSILLS